MGVPTTVATGIDETAVDVPEDFENRDPLQDPTIAAKAATIQGTDQAERSSVPARHCSLVPWSRVGWGRVGWSLPMVPGLAIQGATLPVTLLSDHFGQGVMVFA